LRFAIQDRDGELLSRLSENHRTLLLAKGSYKELAEQFGVTLGTMRSRFHRAREKLQFLRQDADRTASSNKMTV
jgi:DNA-directed RNA polymerase specialized sigma24 family protein